MGKRDDSLVLVLKSEQDHGFSDRVLLLRADGTHWRWLDLDQMRHWVQELRREFVGDQAEKVAAR